MASKCYSVLWKKSFLMKNLILVFTAKNIAIFLGLAVIAFGAATIVLAIQKGDLNSELNEAREKLEALEEELKKTTTPPQIVTTPSSSNPGSTPSETTPINPGSPSSVSTPTNPGSPSPVTTPTNPGSSPPVTTPGSSPITTPTVSTTTDDSGHEQVRVM